MTEKEAEAFSAGAGVWDAVLPPAREEDLGAKRFAACLMIHNFYLSVVGEPRRSIDNLRRLLEYLNSRPTL